jgi:hypothetical protein
VGGDLLVFAPLAVLNSLPMSIPPRIHRARQLAIALLIVSPIFFCAYIILRFGLDFPFLDQWNCSFLFEKYSRGELTLQDLFVQQLEYRQFFPQIIFVFLGALTGWDVRYEMLVSLLLCIASALALLDIERRILPSRKLSPVFALSILLLFSPVQVTNWLNGVQLIYFIPIWGLFTGIALCYSTSSFLFRFAGCFFIATFSTFSAVNGLFLWLVFLPALLLLDSSFGSKRKIVWSALWVAGFTANVFFYLNDYHKPMAHPNPLQPFSFPHKALGYALSLIGRPFSLYGLRSFDTFPVDETLRAALVVSMAIGLVIAALSAGLVWMALKSKLNASERRRLVGPMAMLAFGYLTVVMITCGRMGIGMKQSLTPRYSTYLMPIPIAIVILAVIFMEIRPQLLERLVSKRVALILLAAVLLVQLALFPIGYAQAVAFNRRMLQAKACLTWGAVTSNPVCLLRIFDDMHIVTNRAKAINQLGLLRPRLKNTNVADPVLAEKCPELGRSLKKQDLGRKIVITGRSYREGQRAWVDQILLGCKGSDQRERLIKIAAFFDDNRITPYLASSTLGPYLEWKAEIEPVEVPGECRSATNPSFGVWAYDAKEDHLCRIGEVQ